MIVRRLPFSRVINSCTHPSELHVFRGHQPSPTGFIMVRRPQGNQLALGELISLQGHEFTGTVEEMGSAVKNFKKGDQVVSPFTVSWSANLPFNADLGGC